MWSAWDWTPFFTELAAAIAGVGLGIPLGLWLNRRAERLQRRREERQAKARRLWLLKALQEEVAHNLELLNQLEGELKNNWVPLYSLDTDMWGFLGGQVAQDISLEKILASASRLYFEFDHMKRKIDALFQLFANPLMSSSDEWQQRRSDLSRSMLDHLPPTKRLCKEVLDLLKDSIKKQDIDQGPP
jgi:hypothetical protein